MGDFTYAVAGLAIARRISSERATPARPPPPSRADAALDAARDEAASIGNYLHRDPALAESAIRKLETY